MRRMATILSVLLAASTAASAQPWYGRPVPGDHDRRPYDQRTDEGARRGDQGNYPQQHEYMALVQAYPTERPRQFIPLGGQFGRLTRIRLSRAAGEPFIHRVVVKFANGEEQAFEENKPLIQGTSAVYIYLGVPRVVQQVIVYSRPDPNSAYSVEGAY